MDGINAEPAHAPRDLGDYLGLCWRFKAVIAGVAIVAGVGAFASSLMGPRTYESTVTFAAGPSKIGDGAQATPSTAAFRPMVDSLTTAAAVINDLELAKPPHNLRPVQLLSQVMQVKEIRGTNLITVTVGYNDPALAASIANSVADHAVQTARRVSASEASHARDLIKEQLDLAEAQLNTSDAALMTYRQKARIEAVRKDVEARLGGPQLPVFTPRTQPGGIQLSVAVAEPASGRDGLLDLAVKIAGQKAAIAAAEKQNQTASLAALRSELASLEQQKTTLASGYRLDAATLAVLNQLYVVEMDLARHQLERDVAERTYTDLSQRYQDARLQVIGRSAEFVIIDPAVPADRPRSRQVARNTLTAMVIAWLFAVAAVVMWDAAQRRRVLAS